MPVLPPQRYLFDVPADIAYFNAAYNSPLLNASCDRLLAGAVTIGQIDAGRVQSGKGVITRGTLPPLLKSPAHWNRKKKSEWGGVIFHAKRDPTLKSYSRD